MKIIFLGTGTGLPSLRRSAPGIVVKTGVYDLVFDLGPGASRKFPAVRTSCRDIEAIFFTHFHVDHVADLAPFLFASRYPDLPRNKDLYLFGPPGLEKHYEKLTELYGQQIIPKNYSLIIRELGSGQFHFAGLRITTRFVKHKQHSIGYRLENEEGKTLVYSGDTDYCEELLNLCRGANLLVLECSFPSKREGHLDPEYTGKIASLSGAKKLVLNHLYPVSENEDILQVCRTYYSGEVVIADDLLEIELD
ncbi:ribonuclease Z [bacterium]|nr:ribonuclease Z [bacterium]